MKSCGRGSRGTRCSRGRGSCAPSSRQIWSVSASSKRYATNQSANANGISTNSRDEDARQLLVAAPRQRDVEPGVTEQQCSGDDEGGEDELTHAPTGPRGRGESEGQRDVETDPRDAPLVRGVAVGERHRQHTDPRREHHGRAGRSDERDQPAPPDRTRHRGRHRALRQPAREQPPLVLVEFGHFGACRHGRREPRRSLHVAHTHLHRLAAPAFTTGTTSYPCPVTTRAGP